MLNKNDTDKKIFSKKYECPICAEVCQGRRGLTIHVKKHYAGDKKIRANGELDKMSEMEKNIAFKTQEAVVYKIFGTSKVKSVLKDFLAGKYTLKNLPINIRDYIKFGGFDEEAAKIARRKNLEDEKREREEAERMRKRKEAEDETGERISAGLTADKFLMFLDSLDDSYDKNHICIKRSDSECDLVISDMKLSKADDSGHRKLNVLAKDKSKDDSRTVREVKAYLKHISEDSDLAETAVYKGSVRCLDVVLSDSKQVCLVFEEKEETEKEDKYKKEEV